MATKIDESAIYSEADLVALGITAARQSKAIGDRELTPLKRGTRTYAGSEVARFLGLTSKATSKPTTATTATKPASATETTPNASRGMATGIHPSRMTRSERLAAGVGYGPQYKPAAMLPTVVSKGQENDMDAKSEFEAAVQAKVDAGMDRATATARVVRENPQLHREYVEAVNRVRR